jgi:Phage late-transcription coactivator
LNSESTALNSFNVDVCMEIEQIVINHAMPYIDAVIFYCEKNDIDIEIAASYIKESPKIRSEIEIEGENLNFLKKTRRLPV